MPISRAKTAAELYADCRDYDLVLVPDPPLGDALNRRLAEPHFGPFAITPRRLAAGRREAAEDRTAFLEIIERTDLDWKAAAEAIGNVLQCWDNQGSLEAILDYDAYDTPTTRTVIECLGDIETTSKRLADYQIPADRDVAVVGIDEFTALERSILPAEYRTIDPLTDEPFDLPPFRIYDSPSAIVDTLLESITADNADRVAIVLDRGSQYAPLVESALEAADIPYYGGPGFTDHPDHRAFLRLLRAAHAGSDLRVGDVRPVLTRLGVEVPIDHDDKRLHAVDLPGVDWLRSFCREVHTHRFGDAIDEFESVSGNEIEPIREELDRLGLLEEPITNAALTRLEFYLQSYEVPVDRTNEGVLLADATAAATVDRPAVFFLGLDEGWTQSPPQRPWIDRDALFTRHIQQFQRRLQNGGEQYYLVLDERGGRAVTPCLYFAELLDGTIERFTDLPFERQGRSYQTTGDGFDRTPLDVETDHVETISQSGLNSLVNCPRDYLFSDLVDGPDRDYFVVGNYFHDFAEVYATNPDAVDAGAVDAVVDLMVAETRPFAPDVHEGTNRTRFRAGLETIMAYLDSNPPEGAGFLTGRPGWWDNDVAEHLGLDLDAPHTEWWFEDADLGIKGKIDLVHSPVELLDYKSGRMYSAREVVSKSAIEATHDAPNFQALLYLTYLRSNVPDEPLSFTFFHFLETLDEHVTGEADLADCITRVEYYPVPFEEYIGRVAVFDQLLEDGPADCAKTFDKVGYDVYAAVVDGHDFPEGSTKAEVLDSDLGEAMHARATAIVGDYTYVENGTAQALSALADIRDSTYFADDLDAFEAFVQERLAELNPYRAGDERFPVDGLGGEPNYRRVDTRDMILEGDD